MNYLEINQVVDVRRYVGEIITEKDFIRLVASGQMFLTQMILGKNVALGLFGRFMKERDIPNIGYYEGTIVTIKPFDYHRAEKIALARELGEEIRGVAVQYYIKTKFTNPQGLFIPN